MEKAKLSAEEIKRVKGLGCLQDKRYADRFNVRVITGNGKMTGDKFKAVAEAAERFGNGEVTLTARLTLEIQDVPYEQLDAVRAFLAERGLQTGGTGAKVRPVVSCKGTTCQYGLCDTFALSERLHKLFYEGWHEVPLAHKFKIAVGGCPNNCAKVNLNDLGIVGQRVPALDTDKCHGCKTCQVEKHCPMDAVRMEDGKAVIDAALCNNCGLCVAHCPFHALDASGYGYQVYIGGRWGKKTALGAPLGGILHTEDEVVQLVERILTFYRDNGVQGERFADTISRIGFDAVQKALEA